MEVPQELKTTVTLTIAGLCSFRLHGYEGTSVLSSV